MATPLSSFGVRIEVGNGATPEVFAPIARIKDVSGPGLSANIEETTAHDSPGGWVERIKATLDAGEVSFDVDFVPNEGSHTGENGLLAQLQDRDPRNFRLVLPDADTTTWAFRGFVSNMSTSFPVSGVMSGSITISITGQPVLGAGV